MTELSTPRIRRLQAMRDRIVRLLTSSRGLSRQDICKSLWHDPVVGVASTPNIMYAAVGEALKIYDRDFYQDPSTKKWMLTWERRGAEEAKQADLRNRTGHRFGATYAGKTGEAIDG
jgi:hypothetical protein